MVESDCDPYAENVYGLLLNETPAMNWSHIRRLSIVMRALEDAAIEIEDVLETVIAINA
jgi:hypothetical protein